MSDIKNRDYILEAIDQLRRRKARPDIQRICNFMTRRFGVDSKDTKLDLQHCVDKEIVYKVEYKGSISYRNAAKKSYGVIKKDTNVLNNDVSLPMIVKTNRREFGNIVITAVADLILGEPDYLEFGVPADELMKKILSKQVNKYSKKVLTVLLQREVEIGGLIKMENGNFSLGPSSRNDDSDKSEEEYTTMNTSDDLSPPPAKIKKKPGPKPGRKKEMKNAEGQVAVRLGVRRKRAKKVFDPSENVLPKTNRKRGRPLGSLNKSTLERQQSAALNRSADTSPAPSSSSSHSHRITTQTYKPMQTYKPTQLYKPVQTYKPAPGFGRDSSGGVCSVCHLQGKKGTCDRMVSCRECSNKAHYECLNTEDGMLKMHPDNTWQCPHCKSCVVCYETSDAGALTVCSICADAYHSLCHEPAITEKAKDGFRWVCSNCKMDPLLTENIGKLKYEKSETLEKSESEKNSITRFSSGGTIDQMSPTPTNSGQSSPYMRSPVASPTPPMLSPQAANHNGGPQSTCSDKFNMSDSQSIKDFDTEDSYDPTIPDASNWSFDDVYNYFVQYFPEEAIVFKEQEIDGHSLLLMRRVDVLTSLNLKLGPALKIYRHVVKLQVRKDDTKLYWL